jgi:putative oxidoreductase
MLQFRPLLEHMGRAGLASLFILSGIGKIVTYATVAARMEGVGLWPALLPLVILLELGGGLVLLIGHRFASTAALVLGVHTLAVNAFFHHFWTLSGPVAMLELSLFFKNVTIAGGMFFASAMLEKPAALEDGRALIR